jgi:hypothetical protein
VVPGYHILKYKSTKGTEFYFNLANNEIPMVNGEYINYTPDMVFNSPYLNSKYKSGIVKIRKADKELVLDFNK